MSLWCLFWSLRHQFLPLSILYIIFFFYAQILICKTLLFVYQRSIIVLKLQFLSRMLQFSSPMLQFSFIMLQFSSLLLQCLSSMVQFLR